MEQMQHVFTKIRQKLVPKFSSIRTLNP